MCAITRQAQLRSIHHVFKFKDCHHPHPTHPTPPHPQKLQFGHGVVNPAVSNNKHSLEEQPVHLATITPSILAPVQLARPGWLPRQSKVITASWLAWNLKQIPLALKCQINNVKSQIFSNITQTWIPLGKLKAIYNFAASIFCTAQSLFRTILDTGWLLLSQSSNSCAAACAVEMWAQMGQTTRTPRLP